MAEMGYCVKCRAKSEMVDAVKVTMKNGRPATKVSARNAALKYLE